MMIEWEPIQRALLNKGYYMPPLTIDGIPGGGTRVAMIKFRRDKQLGVGDSLILDSHVLMLLGLPALGPNDAVEPPWMPILQAKMGLREVADKAALEAFLRSDGSTLGDPSKFPWCGDLAETVMLNSGYGPVPSNPYLALNWGTYGADAAELGYGVLVVYRRPGPNGNEGHVGFIVGISADGTRHRVRGGNENNQIGDAWIAADRLAFKRLPKTYNAKIPKLPVLKSDGTLSTNEA